MELEGLRGIAALAVVVGHFLYAFYPALILGTANSVQHMRFEDNIYGTPLAALFSGTFAVAIFFVLSGFVLTIGFFQTKRSEIIKKLASKRYLRLMLPALASVLLCFVLMKSGFANIDSAAAITQSKWLGDAWSVDGNILDAFVNGTFGIFIEGKSAYNNVLWTMTTEFLGSFMVFGFALFFAHSKYRWAGYVVLGALTFNTWFLAFVIGMVLADMYSTGALQRFKKRYILGSFLAIGLFLGGYPRYADGTVYDTISPSFLAGSVNLVMLFLTIGAGMLVFVALMSNRASHQLKVRNVSVLGKYTFSLYLVHLAVLYTFTTGVFVQLQNIIGYNKAVLVSLFLSVPVVWIATRLFEKYVDAPSIAFAKRCADVYDGKEEFDWRQRFVSAKGSLQLKWAIAKSRVATELRRTEDSLE